MSASVQQIQAIKIEDTPTTRIEAEVEVLQAVDSAPSQLQPYQGTVENLYHLQIDNEEGRILATLYITDDPEADLVRAKEELESMVDERRDLLRGSTQRDDLVRAIALQSKMTDIGKSIKFKEQLLELSNPALEGENSKITASVI